MTKLTQTVGEARDYILKRIGAEGSTEYQALVLDMLNHALAFVAIQHDWSWLREVTTFTTTDATGVVILSADVERILAIYETGSNVALVELDPIPFLEYKLGQADTESIYFCKRGTNQSTDTIAPSMKIDIYPAPDSGTTYNLWYIKYLDEFTDTTDVPPIPPSAWELIIKKATLEALNHTEAPANTIRLAEKHMSFALMSLKRREDLGSSKSSSLKLPANVENFSYDRYVRK